MLLVPPPVLPMLAKRVAALPDGEGWLFEPKWDGFRTLVFRDGAELTIQSRDEKTLNRYFPEIIPPLLEMLPDRCVLDGEIVVAKDGGLDFEALQLRIHPAASRVKMLSKELPTSVVFWDLLCLGDRDLRAEPFRVRRAELEALLAGAKPPLHITPATSDRAVAADWFKRFEGAGLDGVMAKSVSGAYEPNKRVMLKVKHERDCDCVVAGFRWYKGNAGTSRSDRSCSVSTTTRGRSSTSASRRASRRRSGASSSRSSRRTGRTRSRTIPGSAIGPGRK